MLDQLVTFATTRKSGSSRYVLWGKWRSRGRGVVILASVAALLASSAARAQTINTAAGNGIPTFGGDGTAAVFASLNRPRGVAFDASGNYYIADMLNHRIRRVSPSATITTFAGNGSPGFSGDGGAAVNAQLNEPEDVFADASGNVYIADSSNHRIRKVTPSGIITTIAGVGSFGFNGDNIAAVNAQLNRPTSITMDTSGNLYVADSSNHRVRRISASGTITTVAGNGIQAYAGNGGPATSASLRFPVGVALDSVGNLYIADAGNHVVREVTTAGIIFNAAGNGVGAGTDRGSFSGDFGAASAAGLNTPEDVVVDSANNLFIADTGNYRIRKVTSAGTITTLAGTGSDGFSGDGSSALAATFNLPWSVTMDATGNLMVGDMLNHRIRRIFGAGAAALPLPTGSGGSGLAPAVSSILNNASYTSGPVTIAPGSIVALFGSNLTDGGACVQPDCNPTFGADGRLNTTMTGAQVTVNGTAVPIFYSTPNQLGIQIPTELTGASATVQVSVNGRASASRTFSVGAAAPGIFTINQQGTGTASITHGDGSAVLPGNPARRGEMVTLWATGLGQVAPFVPTGALGSSRTVASVTVFIDNIAVIPEFAGMSGCCVGLNQVNFAIPASVRSANDIQIRVSTGGQISNTVTIAVQ